MTYLAVEIERVVTRLIEARQTLDVEHAAKLEALGRDQDGQVIASAMRITK